MPEPEATLQERKGIPRPRLPGRALKIYTPPHNIYAQHVTMIGTMAELRVAQRRQAYVGAEGKDKSR